MSAFDEAVEFMPRGVSVPVSDKMDNLKRPVAVRTWNEREFASSAREWNELLDESTADPLFMSWEWQWNWWRHYGEMMEGELFLLAAYQPDGRLVGLAPLYRHRARHRYGLPGVRIEAIGSYFRDWRVPWLTEYIDLIVAKSRERAVLAAFAKAIRADHSWSDLVIGNTPAGSMAVTLAKDHFARDCHVREADVLSAHVVRLPERFEDYVARLKAESRRKIWSRRRRLESPHLAYATEADIEPILDHIDKFHWSRFQHLTFVKENRGFHVAFCKAMARRHALRMSVLSTADGVISAMHNVAIRDTEYNIQSGFSPAASSLSPAYLHHGYCMEDACARGIRNYDFLAGPGRSRQYKQDFMTDEVTLFSLQIIRGRLLRTLYRAYDHRTQAVRALPGSNAAQPQARHRSLDSPSGHHTAGTPVVA